MGTQRARNDTEKTARRDDILNAAAQLLMSEEYDDITLATISQKTNISRPSMYNYYKTKEEIFLDIMAREYLLWQSELADLFPRKVSRNIFCSRLASSLVKKHLLVRLFSLRQFRLEEKCGEKKMKEFNNKIGPFFGTFTEILSRQFPTASKADLDMLKIQFTLYSHSVYPITQMKDEQINNKLNTAFFGKIPELETIYYRGLMLLTSELEK